jgi:hypothetical protein
MEFQHRNAVTSVTDERAGGLRSRLLSIGSARVVRYCRQGKGDDSFMTHPRGLRGGGLSPICLPSVVATCGIYTILLSISEWNCQRTESQGDRMTMSRSEEVQEATAIRAFSFAFALAPALHIDRA